VRGKGSYRRNRSYSILGMFIQLESLSAGMVLSDFNMFSRIFQRDKCYKLKTLESVKRINLVLD